MLRLRAFFVCACVCMCVCEGWQRCNAIIAKGVKRITCQVHVKHVGLAQRPSVGHSGGDRAALTSPQELPTAVFLLRFSGETFCLSRCFLFARQIQLASLNGKKKNPVGWPEFVWLECRGREAGFFLCVCERTAGLYSLFCFATLILFLHRDECHKCFVFLLSCVTESKKSNIS